MKSSIISKTAQGLKWNYLSVILSSIFQLIHITVMARLLEPADYGLLAMAEVVLRFGVYFSRMGVGQAIIQKVELSAKDIRAGFTISVFLSLIVTLFIVIAAPLAMLLFDNTEVIPIVRVYAFTMFIAGWNIVSVSLLRRNFRFRELFIAEATSYFIGAMVVGIVLAYLGLGVWSLVISSLVQGIVLTVITYSFTRHSLQPLFSKRQFHPLLSFGGRISLISVLEYFSHNLDTLVIGRYFSTTLLGVYNQANRLINLPAQKISTGMIMVLFSSFSDIQEDNKKLQKAHLISIEILGLIIFPFAFGISGAAREAVLVLLGEKWIDAIPVLRILALSVPFFLVNGINGVLFDAKNFLRTKIKLVIFRLVFCILLILLLFRFGLIGIAISILILSFVYYIVFTWVAHKKLAESLPQIARTNSKIIGSGLITLLLVIINSMVMGMLNINLYLIFIVEIMISGLVLMFFIYIRPSKQLVAFIKQKLFQDNYRVPPFIIQRIKRHYEILYARYLNDI